MPVTDGETPQMPSIATFAIDRTFSFRIPSTHPEHSEKGPTDQTWIVVLLTVCAMTEPGGRIRRPTVADQAWKRKRVRLLILRYLR
jgi:hypothetical protein